MSRDGCREAVIEHNRLELAEARLRNFYGFGEEDIVVLAVALMAGVARAHAFEQGNKRTAFGALRLFLRANGYDTAFDDTISWAEEIIAPVERRGFRARGSSVRGRYRVTRTKRLRPAGLAASVRAWQTSGP